MNALINQGDEQYYSQNGFWNKLRNFARTAGREVVEHALSLYYTAQAPDTPAGPRRLSTGYWDTSFCRSMQFPT